VGRTCARSGKATGTFAQMTDDAVEIVDGASHFAAFTHPEPFLAAMLRSPGA
jgi:hypothetical protein